MPELPEIEVLRRTVAPVLVGRVLRVKTIGPHDMRARGSGRGEGRCKPGAWMNRNELLDGATVQSVERHGKRLAILATDGRCLVIQLGMSGQLIAGPSTTKPHQHLVWSIIGGHRCQSSLLLAQDFLVFRDPRRFGGVVSYESKDELQKSWTAELGPDALTINASALQSVLCGSRAIKVALLDQATIAGVGNIYADESLHVAGIDPRMRCDQISKADVKSLAQAIRLILNRATKHGGSTLRDYRSGLGAKGAAQALHAVYGHAGQPCAQCGETLQGTRLGGRATVWCPFCQPRRRR